MSGRRLTCLALAGALCLSGCDYAPSWLGGSKKKIERLPGERINVLKSSTQLEPDASLAGSAPVIPAQEANDSWMQHGGNAQAHPVHPALPAKLENERSATVGDGNDFAYHLVISPVAGGGVIYAMDASGHVSAHDMKDISDVRWISPGVATEDDDVLLGGGLAYEDQRIYASSGKGLVVMLDAATGVEAWRQQLGTPIRSAPRVEDGKVYVVTVDSQLYALDAKNGSVLWNHRGVNEGRGFLIEAAPAAQNDLVIAPYSSGEVHALRSYEGSPVWSDAVMGPQRQSAISVFTGIGGDPVLADGVLYVAGSAGMFAAFHAETGRRLWDQPISSISTPWVAGDNVYVLTTDSAVVALNRLDGRVRWVNQLPRYDDEEEKKGAYLWNGPVLAGGRLMVVGAHGEMAEINPEDGKLLGMVSVPEGIYAAPIVAGGVLYAVSEDAVLHALY